jgi:hypothetical protein
MNRQEIKSLIRGSLSTLMLLLCVLHQGRAQEESAPYYVNVNSANLNKVHEVQNKTIALQYDDYNGQWKEVPLVIYDWKRTKVAELKLSKVYGLNNFIVNLDEVKASWVLNEVYTFELTTENGRKHDLLVKLIPAPEKIGPEVDIIVNPVQFKCDAISAKLMEFYGDVKGGKAPYTTKWFVLNNQRDDFLYQPREEKITSAGQTMVVRVDKAPDYFVMLYVTDACGNVNKKMVHVVCEEGKKKINTIFMEPLNKTLLDKLNARKN